MMYNRLVHTPEGVRDIYGQEYARKLSVQEADPQTVLGPVRIRGYSDAGL